MRKIFTLLCILTFVGTACVTSSLYTESQGRYLNPTANANVTPMAADLNVSPQRITFEIDYDKTKNQGMSVDKAKAYAIAATLAKYKADVLVAPLVNVTENSSTIHVMVCGYTATYKNFRKATLQDLNMDRSKSRKNKSF
ncbi:MAG: hypothetical protein K6F40_00395 [Bacteroidales bacterium]|nr:hypothetical protein [Bacteroidales bacterium]